MKALTKEDIINFEFNCDWERISVAERVEAIKDAFGEEEAELYAKHRCKIIPFPGKHPQIDS